MQGLTFFRPELKYGLEGCTGVTEGESITMLAGQTKPLTDVAFRALTFDLTLQGQSFRVGRVKLQDFMDFLERQRILLPLHSGACRVKKLTYSFVSYSPISLPAQVSNGSAQLSLSF